MGSHFNEAEKGELRESIQQLLRWGWRYNKNLEEQAAQLHMLTGWSQIVEVADVYFLALVFLMTDISDRYVFFYIFQFDMFVLTSFRFLYLGECRYLKIALRYCSSE